MSLLPCVADFIMLYTVCKVERFVLAIIKQRLLLFLTKIIAFSSVRRRNVSCQISLLANSTPVVHQQAVSTSGRCRQVRAGVTGGRRISGSAGGPYSTLLPACPLVASTTRSTSRIEDRGRAGLSHRRLDISLMCCRRELITARAQLEFRKGRGVMRGPISDNSEQMPEQQS